MRIFLVLKAESLEKSLTFSGYKLQGRTKFQGMDISIENRKGSVRRGTDSDGHKWATKMIVPYGYIRGTIGVDKDHVDCFLGHNGDSTKVFVIHQIVPKTGKFDEDKVMLGFNNAKEAKKMYLRHYDKPDYFGSMTEMSIDEFKKKAFNSGKGKILKSLEFKLFVDMDGVLTNFKSALKNKLGIELKSNKIVTDNNIWDKVSKIDGFWYMDWMPEGKKLWNNVKKYNPVILTTPAADIEKCKKEKRKWVKDKLGNNVKIIFAENGKGEYAKKNHILIDDMNSNIKDWVKSNGQGLLYDYRKNDEILKNLNSIIKRLSPNRIKV